MRGSMKRSCTAFLVTLFPLNACAHPDPGGLLAQCEQGLSAQASATDGCTEDCSGHDAGYQWAQDNGIDDPDDCSEKRWSFEEGCRSYPEEK